jgi:hypothetical protein
VRAGAIARIALLPPTNYRRIKMAARDRKVWLLNEPADVTKDSVMAVSKRRVGNTVKLELWSPAAHVTGREQQR